MSQQLVFNGVNDDGPLFVHCQACDCGQSAQFRQMKAQLIKDFNGLVAFTCPSGKHSYQLYVALHKYEDDHIGVCIQRSDAEGAGGIPDNWWQK